MNFGSIKLIKPTWYCSYYSKLIKKKKKRKKKKKDKVAQQNGTVDVQRKNIRYTMIYIKGKKSTNGRLEKKRKIEVAIVAIVPLGTIVTVQNLKKKKKKKNKVANQNETIDDQ